MKQGLEKQSTLPVWCEAAAGRQIQAGSMEWLIESIVKKIELSVSISAGRCFDGELLCEHEG